MDDKNLLRVYMEGFNDELDKVFKEDFQGSELEVRAYNLGALAALFGDDLKTMDYLTDEQLIRDIRKNGK